MSGGGRRTDRRPVRRQPADRAAGQSGVHIVAVQVQHLGGTGLVDMALAALLRRVAFAFDRLSQAPGAVLGEIAADAGQATGDRFEDHGRRNHLAVDDDHQPPPAASELSRQVEEFLLRLAGELD